MTQDWLSEMDARQTRRPGRVARWKRVSSIADLEPYLLGNRVAPDHAAVICRQVYSVFKKVRSVSNLIACNAEETVDRKFPMKSRRGRAELRTSVIRYQQMMKGKGF